MNIIVKQSQQVEDNMSEDRTVKPWDLFNKNMERALSTISEKRLEICKECPRLIKFTNQCKECGCLMNLKVKLADASCPLGKWNKVNSNIPFDREIDEKDIERIMNE